MLLLILPTVGMLPASCSWAQLCNQAANFCAACFLWLPGGWGWRGRGGEASPPPPTPLPPLPTQAGWGGAALQLQAPCHIFRRGEGGWWGGVPLAPPYFGGGESEYNFRFQKFMVDVKFYTKFLLIRQYLGWGAGQTQLKNSGKMWASTPEARAET